jgi:hypothetical protein
MIACCEACVITSGMFGMETSPFKSPRANMEAYRASRRDTFIRSESEHRCNTSGTCVMGAADRTTHTGETRSITTRGDAEKQVRQHHRNMPPGKEGQGGNFRGAYRRVRLVIE